MQFKSFLNKNNNDYKPKELEMVSEFIKNGEIILSENTSKLDSLSNTVQEKLEQIDMTKESLVQEVTNNLLIFQDEISNKIDTAIENLGEIKSGEKGEKGDPGKDGITPDVSFLKEEILSEIKIPEIKSITGEEVIDKINSLPLEEDNKIDWSRIKNTPKINKQNISGSPTVISNAVDLDGSTRQDTYAIVWDSTMGRYTHAASGGGGGSPGGSDTQLQYNNNGAFGGISGATTNGTIVTLTSPTLVTPALGTPSSGVLTNATGLPISGLVSSTSTALGVGSLELGNASDTTLSRASAGRLAVEGVNVVTVSSTDTLTNKTLFATSNVISESTNTSSSSTPTPTGGSLRNDFQVTALAANATFGAPSGTPSNNNSLIIRIKDNGTARTLAFNAIYRFSSDLPAPTTTVISKTMYLGFVYNSADSKWDCIAQINNI